MSKSLFTAPFLIAAIIAGSSPAAASDKAWHTFADIGAIGIPVAAATITYFENDRNGFIQLAETGAVALGTSEILKYSIPEQRPNGGDHSFPSAHTASAFAGAGFIHARYGWRMGLPFELLAAGVGFARVQSHDHHWYDVVAGAAIGEGSAFLLTRRLSTSSSLTAYGDTGGGGVSFSTRF